MAADLVSKNYSSKEMGIIILSLIEKGKIREGGIGLYNGFIHYDIRGELVLWNDSSRFKNLL